MSKGWQIVSLDEIELPQLVNSPQRSPLRHHFGIESFGVNAWRGAEAEDDVISEHDEVSNNGERHEELYIVLAGRATFTVDGETFEATPGAAVFVREPATKRKATAAEPGTRILALGGRRGEAFEPSAWERSAAAFPYFASGDYERARELLAEAHATWPDDATVLYNLACAESKTGRTADALDHLGRALASAPERLKEVARADSDLDAIRDEDEFKRLVD